MRIRSSFIFFLLIGLWISPGMAAEKHSPVTADARVLKSKLKIGDEIRLLLRTDHPRSFTILPPDPKMNLAPFEIKSIEPVPAKKGQNRVEETFRMSLVVFQTGDLKIPPIPVRYTDAGGESGAVKTEPVPIKILSVGKKLTDKDDIRSIKGPALGNLTKFWMGVEALLAGALFVFLVVRLTRRILKDRLNAEERKPPQERVKIELKRLKDKGYLEEKKYREYYSDFSDVLRRYFERRFHVEALEETSSEILKELEKLSVASEVRTKAGEVLKESDLVKFAKMIPSYELAGKLEALLIEIVEATPPEPVKK